jgi:hypothetical protein
MAYNDVRAERPRVNLTFDNLTETKRQIELAQRRIGEGKAYLADKHLRNAIFHLDTHRVQQAERKRLGMGVLE